MLLLLMLLLVQKLLQLVFTVVLIFTQFQEIVTCSSHFSEQLQNKKYASDAYLKTTNDHRFHTVLIM